MHAFEAILVLLMGATILSSFATRVGVPYPTILAVGGAVLAFVPGAPRIELPPELILALFVAPVLLDAAYDASFRDLRANWLPVGSLVLVAVGLTTMAVAVTARWFFPDMPWAVGIALGAILAPPDAVAALAVLRQVSPPYRIRVILEGESLLNDASALLIYRLAVGAVTAGSFSVTDAAPTFAVVVFGSILTGWALAWPIGRATARIQSAPESVVFQFVVTFGAWLLAERLGLSGVVTVVVLGLTLARKNTAALMARIRVPSFAIWETVTMVLNVMAFTLVGLEIGPIVDNVSRPELRGLLVASLTVLGVVILVRLVWALTYEVALRVGTSGHGAKETPGRAAQPSAKAALVVGWSGMRGIVTLATALALPADFPYRDFIQLTAFVVVLGTLLIQGLTLRRLLAFVDLPPEDTVEREIDMARRASLKAAILALDGEDDAAAGRLREEYREALAWLKAGEDLRDTRENGLRLLMVTAARRSIAELRDTEAIGDEAYRRVEEELDMLELSAQAARPTGPAR
jgi:monovalent cation/hydrogen antiporter